MHFFNLMSSPPAIPQQAQHILSSLSVLIVCAHFGFPLRRLHRYYVVNHQSKVRLSNKQSQGQRSDAACRRVAAYLSCCWVSRRRHLLKPLLVLGEEMSISSNSIVCTILLIKKAASMSQLKLSKKTPFKIQMEAKREKTPENLQKSKTPSTLKTQIPASLNDPRLI